MPPISLALSALCHAADYGRMPWCTALHLASQSSTPPNWRVLRTTIGPAILAGQLDETWS